MISVGYCRREHHLTTCSRPILTLWWTTSIRIHEKSWATDPPISCSTPLKSLLMISSWRQNCWESKPTITAIPAIYAQTFRGGRNLCKKLQRTLTSCWVVRFHQQLTKNLPLQYHGWHRLTTVFIKNGTYHFKVGVTISKWSLLLHSSSLQIVHTSIERLCYIHSWRKPKIL